MEECVYNIESTIIGEADGSKTYEVRKKYDFEGRTAVIISLYPTVSLLSPYTMDKSTLFLLNHARELGYSCIRVLNIFPNVFKSKPMTKQLRQCDENIAYIKSVLNDEKDSGADIIIAWGTSLRTNETSNDIKGEIVDMIIELGLEKSLKRLTGSGLEDEHTCTPHMLWLGLHCNGMWYAEKLAVAELCESIGKVLIEQEKVKKPKARSKTKAKELN